MLTSAYSITDHADWKSSNLIYQLQCTECDAFYIGETCHSLSDSINGLFFTITVMNPDQSVAISTKSHQITFYNVFYETYIMGVSQ